MVVSSIAYLVSFVLIIYGIQNQRLKYAELFVVLIFMGLVFCFQPLTSDDLRREYEILDEIRKYGWSYFSQNSHFIEGSVGRITSNKFNGVYVSQLLYYIFSKFPVYNFFPALVVGVQYYLEFKLINKLRKRYELSATCVLWVLLSMLCFREFRFMASGIRNQLAFTIALYTLYSDLVEKKKFLKCAVVYILCGMIHQSAYVILFLRVALFVPSRNLKIVITLVLLSWSNCMEILMNYLSRFVSNPIINSIVWKLVAYTEGGTDNLNVVVRPYYKWCMISNIGIIILCLFTGYCYWRFNKKNVAVCPASNVETGGNYSFMRRLFSHSSGESDVIWFLIFSTALTIGANMYYWLYLRFAIILQIWIAVAMAILFHRIRNYKNVKSHYTMLIIIAIICKFTIMVLVVNASFNFSLFGSYPR